MSSWDEGLKGVHKRIAGDTGARLHVLAGPGTGKTFALMRRIARLLETGVPAPRILAVSFTRTAARDLREQLEGLGLEDANSVYSSTLHALCFSILSSEAAFAFNGRHPRPLMSFETEFLVADLAAAFHGKKEVRRSLKAYEAAWARLQHDDPGHTQTAADQLFENALVDWLRFHEAMLVGELVPLALAFLQVNPQVDARRRFDHILVDEYQDLNRAEQELVALFASESALLVIGDDNQSIYSFRYANPDGIRDFPEANVGTKSFTLSACRRCPPNIVALSNALISHDSAAPRPSPLTPDASKTDALIWVVQHRFLEDEITAAADFVDRYLTSHPKVNPGRVLVLATRRFIGNAVRDALIAHGRNALSYFQEDALSTERAAEGFALLTLLVNPDDRAALRAWLGFGQSNGRSPAYRRLREHALETGTPLPTILQELAQGSLKVAYTGSLAERKRELDLRLAELQGLAGLDLVEALWPSTDEDVRDIALLAANIAYGTPAPADLLDYLRTALTQPELPGSDSDIVQVMSLHKSKGLTRKLVLVVGCMAGTLPFIDDDDPPEKQAASLAEQRRLFYVALTRATDVLVISAARALPLATARRGGVAVDRVESIMNRPHAITSFTPFLSELGALKPTVVTTAQWRAQAGF